MLAIALAVTLAVAGGGPGGAGPGAGGPGGPGMGAGMSGGPAGPAGTGFGTQTTGAPTGVQSMATPTQASQGLGNAPATQASQGFGNYAPAPAGQTFGGAQGLSPGFGGFGYGGNALGWGPNGPYPNVPAGWGVDEFGDLVQPDSLDFTKLAYNPEQPQYACPTVPAPEQTPPPPPSNAQATVRNAPSGAVVVEKGTVKDLNLPPNQPLVGWKNPKVLILTPTP